MYARLNMQKTGGRGGDIFFYYFLTVTWHGFCVCVFLTTIGWISLAIFWGKKVDLSTRRLLLIRLWSWLEIYQMLKKVDWFTYVNSSRTVNLHIFLLRLISSILANPGFLVYPHYFFVIFVFIWFMWCCIYLFLTSIYP